MLGISRCMHIATVLGWSVVASSYVLRWTSVVAEEIHLQCCNQDVPIFTSKLSVREEYTNAWGKVLRCFITASARPALETFGRL